MKKALVALSLAALFAGSAVAEEIEAVGVEPQGPVIEGVSGGVNFGGELVPLTCEIKNDNKTVSLPKLWVSQVNNGEVANTPFNLELTNCPSYAGKFVTVEFRPDADSLEVLGSEKLLKNTYQDGAENVALKVKSGTVNILNLSGEEQRSMIGYQELTTGDFEFPFSVEYAKLAGNATAGYVTARLPFTVIYK